MPASPRIEPFQDGAVVRGLQYAVIFGPNLASPEAIDLQLPAGERLTGSILGLAYTEGSRSVWIAQIKDCSAVITGPENNVLTFEDAFTEFRMSVEYRVERGRLSQSVLGTGGVVGPVANRRLLDSVRAAAIFEKCNASRTLEMMKTQASFIVRPKPELGALVKGTEWDGTPCVTEPILWTCELIDRSPWSQGEVEDGIEAAFLFHLRADFLAPPKPVE